MFAIPKTKMKKLKTTSKITISFPAIEMGTISPYPTEEKVIKPKYKNSINCKKNELLGIVSNLKLPEFNMYNA